MLGKILASFRIGSAKVDTILDEALVRQGEVLKGKVQITGGKVAQAINKIELRLVTVNKSDPQKTVKHCWQEWVLDGIGTIEPGEVKTIPFDMPVPDIMPFTYEHRFRTYLKTGADIDFSIDPKDRDEVEITPHRDVQLLLDLLKEMDIQLWRIESTLKYIYSGFKQLCPYHQEYQFIVPKLSGLTIVYLGKGEFVWEREKGTTRFHVTDLDHENGGERLKAFLEEEIAKKECLLVKEVLERMGIKKENRYGRIRYTIPEAYRPYCSEIDWEYIGKKTFVLELDRRNRGIQGAIDDMLDLDESKIRFQVTEQDLADGGQRLEALFRQSLEALKEKGSEGK